MKRSLDIAAIVLTSLLLLGFAVLSVRGFIDPQPASARFGLPVSRCRRRPVLSCVSVPQSRHRRFRRDFPADAAMDPAGRYSDGLRDLAAVRHVLSVAQRRDAAGPSPRHILADCDHRRAALAAGGREQNLAKPPVLASFSWRKVKSAARLPQL